MVNIGDIVEVVFQARDSFTDVRPYYDVESELRTALSAAGFQVLNITTPQGWFGGNWWGEYRVRLVPLTSAYGDVQHIAGIVAGATEQIGMQVDNPNARGQVIARGSGQNLPATTADYEQNQRRAEEENEQNQKGFLAEIARALGISESTLGIALGGGLLIGVIVSMKR